MRRFRPAFSLIEVVVATALSCTLLTLVMTGTLRHLRQLERAEHQAALAEAVDHFLWQLYGEGRTLPVNGRGVIDEQQGLDWQTTLASDQYLERLGIDVVRLVARQRNAAGEQLASLELELAVRAAKDNSAEEPRK